MMRQIGPVLNPLATEDSRHEYTVLPHGRRWHVFYGNTVVFRGSLAEAEVFLDTQENRRRQRLRLQRMKKRVEKLVNWIYNQLY